MSIALDDILKSICSEVTLSHSNDYQRVYSLGTPLEAKLAFEVLVVFGLDVKVYHQMDKPSKLYVTHPKFKPEQLEKIYAGALAYATTLKQLKNSVDAMCNGAKDALGDHDYNIAFLKGQGRTKQILVQIMPSEDARALAGAPASTENSAQAAASAVAAASAQARANLKKYAEKPKSHYEELTSGPAVGRGSYPGKLSADGEAAQNAAGRRLGMQLMGNMTAKSFAMFIVAIIVGLAFSAYVMMRGFICPDLAVANKNRAWYCGGNDEPPPNPKQQPLLSQPPGAAPANPAAPR